MTNGPIECWNVLCIYTCVSFVVLSCSLKSCHLSWPNKKQPATLPDMSCLKIACHRGWLLMVFDLNPFLPRWQIHPLVAPSFCEWIDPTLNHWLGGMITICNVTSVTYLNTMYSGAGIKNLPPHLAPNLTMAGNNDQVDRLHQSQTLWVDQICLGDPKLLLSEMSRWCL